MSVEDLVDFFQRLFNVKLVKVRLILNNKALFFQQISIIK